MIVHLTPELEAKLAAIATRTGRATDELVETAVMRFVDADSLVARGGRRPRHHRPTYPAG